MYESKYVILQRTLTMLFTRFASYSYFDYYINVHTRSEIRGIIYIGN